jgi:hypothetical protein
VRGDPQLNVFQQRTVIMLLMQNQRSQAFRKAGLFLLGTGLDYL